MTIIRTFILTAALTLTAAATAQTLTPVGRPPLAGTSAPAFRSAALKAAAPDTIVPAVSVSDSLLALYATSPDEVFSMPLALPPVFFMPAVYDTYHFDEPLGIGDNMYSGDDALRWTEEYKVLFTNMTTLRRDLFFNHPELVKYNLSTLPVAPVQYTAVVNPADFSISVAEISATPTAPTLEAAEVQKRHWIRTFSASLQFSQAYVSPNWYQGGNNNLNALANIYYNVKLNQEYHPNLLFETTAQYKLGINNAPDDSIHSYNVTEDVFQINTTFGVKAAHRWYYSFTGQFKTQVVNSYKSNSHNLQSAFLSPGELTAGLGMTYNYVNKPKTFNFDASIAPVSYHMITVVNNDVDPGAYGIDPGRKTKNSFGSTAELKLRWRMSYNIVFSSRVFAFTDYDSFQCDWENTLAFDINRFLTTQIYVHARYDTNTPRCADPEWHKLQVKEIFSIGFSYKFASI